MASTYSETTGPPVTKSPPFTRSLPLLRSLHWLTERFRILFKINLLTYKTLREKQPVIFTPCLPHHFHTVHWDQTTIIACQSPGQDQQRCKRFSLLWPIPLEQPAAVCLSVQPIQLLPVRNISRHISVTGPFLHRYQHARWPVDVMEQFHQFCCWTLIRLSRPWARLWREYWRYRSLIDWLIGTTPPPSLSGVFWGL